MACNPLITDDFVFPRRPDNRPGLPRIAYRIGEYPDFVESMTRAIDAALPLAGWTHREPDDPGIALLQGAAIVGDILTFYQEHYANEAYLRTSAWRRSVAELVRLTGYRLAPGIGGRGTFAFEVRGTTPVTIRKGFPIKADLAAVPTAADFQTDRELVAWPHLGRFNLLRPRRYAGVIAGGQATFEIASVGGAADALTLEALDLKEDDRLLLLPEESLNALVIQVVLGWSAAQPCEEIVVVKKVERLFGRLIVTVAGNLTHGWLAKCRAYLLGRTFRHFGFNSPPQFVETDTTVTPPHTTSTPTIYFRDLRLATLTSPGYSPTDPHVFELDQDVSDMASGIDAVLTGIVTNGPIITTPTTFHIPFAMSRRITGITSSVPQCGNITAPSTFVRLNDLLAPAWTAGQAVFADIRGFRLHETVGPVLTVQPVAQGLGGAFADNGANALGFFGTSEQVRALARRTVFLSHSDGRSAELTCVNEAADFASAALDVPQVWPISFDRSPAPFVRADFDEAHPAVTVFGNLVDASQGKQERDAVLGNGDGRKAFQTFPLPKPDLTYFLSSDLFPPQSPELEIFVGGRRWSRVDAFFGRGPKEEIYVVREDADGLSFVQFGDGATGARLPSGVGNVMARYRTGNGARGPIKDGATPSAGERPANFDKVTLAGIVAGGADPEPADKAREAAPGKVQSLGRLVSIQDYETETLAIPGVTTASASWDLDNGIPSVQLRVLLEAGREAEFAAVRAAIAHAQRCHGPDRFPVNVEQARLRYAWLDVAYAHDPRVPEETVAAAIRAALGLAGDGDHERSGLFGLRARRLGDVEYASRVEGRVQNAAGVLWCKVVAFDLFPAPVPPTAPVDPATLALPPAPRSSIAILPCAANELLQLAPAHLTLMAVDEPSAGECQ